MARRVKGEGSIRERADGRWEATLTLPSLNGKRRRRSFFGKTRPEVAKKLREAQRKLDDNLPVPSDRLTVGTYLQQWVEGKQGTIRPESWRRYDDLVRLYLIPELGKHVLSRLQPADLRAAYSRLAGKLSGTSCAHCHGVLHVALRDAEREGLVGRNVASLVPAPRRSTQEQRHLGPDDARAMLAAAEGEAMGPFFIVAISTGLRLGELQALRWQDVDLGRRRLMVRRTLTAMRDGQPVFGPPKTQHSLRTVWLSQTAQAALEQQQAELERLRLAAGPVWREYGLVFTSAMGTPLDGNNVRERHFTRLLDKAKLPRMRFHDLRHSAASLLLADGVPVKVVSELLGHSDISTTLRIYAHVIEGAQEQAADSMDRLLHS